LYESGYEPRTYCSRKQLLIITVAFIVILHCCLLAVISTFFMRIWLSITIVCPWTCRPIQFMHVNFSRGRANDIIVGYCFRIVWIVYVCNFSDFELFYIAIVFAMQLETYQVHSTLVARFLPLIFFHLILQLTVKVSTRINFKFLF